jgi:hypothetical protein
MASFVIPIMNEEIELYFKLKLQVKVKTWKGFKKGIRLLKVKIMHTRQSIFWVSHM